MGRYSPSYAPFPCSSCGGKLKRRLSNTPRENIGIIGTLTGMVLVVLGGKIQSDPIGLLGMVILLPSFIWALHAGSTGKHRYSCISCKKIEEHTNPYPLPDMSFFYKFFAMTLGLIAFGLLILWESLAK